MQVILYKTEKIISKRLVITRLLYICMYTHIHRFFVLDEADGLLKQGYTELIDRLHRQIPKITSDGKRLQMIVCSATLHSFEVKKMAVSFKTHNII